MNWYKIADSANSLQLAENGIALVVVNDRKICLASYRGAWFAFSDNCPHATAPLSKGFLDGGGNVICPLHGYKFSIINGRNTSEEGYKMKTFPTELRLDGLFIGLETDQPPV